ncbi:MAG: NADP-dependent phosphogluconate dehydrogenase [Pseudomonadota bacterium]
MSTEQRLADIGVYGLGTMGAALALNIAENGFQVAVCNREVDWLDPFVARAGPLGARIAPYEKLDAFVAALKRPRKVLFMIPSGAPMDAMIDAITPYLDPDDILIDGGNADFNDTRRRAPTVASSGHHFVGMGVSGGEAGARSGPSMMVGGPVHAWDQLRPVLEQIAARFNGDPCVAHVGPDGAGHFVKTVHNGIEYADMQMIAEIYGYLRDAAGESALAIGALFDRWRSGPLKSYLIDVSAAALQTVDPKTDRALVDVILDQAGQKGTGRWTVIEALKLGQSANAIEAAVAARAWSAEKSTRVDAEAVLPAGVLTADAPSTADLEQALYAGRIIAHAQGFRVLSAASAEFGWSLDLARVSEIWREGCIIRSALLDDIGAAFHEGPPPQDHIVLSPRVRPLLTTAIPALRRVVAAGAFRGVALPALAASLAWYDSLRRGRGTANLIQAQRDFFGAHGFERLDAVGKHHGDWPSLS